MIQKVWKVGNSFVIAIPPNIVKLRGIKAGDYVSIPDEHLTKNKSPKK